ncbi:MAG: TRAFs-binding domain-containing protein [Alphaproteobacteria bacterium]|nr:TRAFs-binding domain-containing protein [Alphaproteobacteria bacterium]
MSEQTELSLVADAETALKNGDLFKAYDIAAAALEAFPASASLRYQAVLALARSGATENAQRLYEKYGIASFDSVDAHTLGARLLKDMAFEAETSSSASLLKAAAAYHRIYEKTGEYYPGINAATLFLLAGDAGQAEPIARRLLDDPALQRDTSYYATATIAEAELLLNRQADAVKTLVRARELAGNDYASLATTRRQFARILQHRGVDARESGLLSALAIPKVAFYCGHMVSGPGGLDEGWQAELRAKLQTAIRETNVGIGFGGLACGADILFAEAFLERGIELNVVLPFKQDDYLKYSVRPGGEPWVERFHNCLKRAASVTLASFDEYVGDPAQYTYGSSVAMGLGHLRARHLQTDTVQLAAFDGVSAAGLAGTATDIATWKKFGGETSVIAFDRAAASHTMRPAIEQKTEKDGPLSRQMRSIIFTDVHGFSKIPESRIPRFWSGIMSRCAATIARFDKNVLYRNTWGDALYLVIDHIAAAADLALSLHDCVTTEDANDLGLGHAPKLRVALHHGPLFEGIDPVCGQKTFFGSEVSRTARIEPVTPLGAVYATEPFAAILAMQAGSQFACNYAGRIELAKGYGAFRMYRLTRSAQA